MKRWQRFIPATTLLAFSVCFPLGSVGITPVHAVSSTDFVGPAGSDGFGTTVRVLSNGNFVVIDPGFDDGSRVDVGAVHVYNGATHQLISTLKGSTQDDAVGSGGITEVGSSNFVVLSPSWHLVSSITGGAVTWVSGTAGLAATVGTGNSMYGTTDNDGVAKQGVVVLTDGDYVVPVELWDGAVVNTGAARWAPGNSSTTGAFNGANSLIGSIVDDRIGDSVTALTNGNYTVNSPFWNDGVTTVNAGAVTFAKGDGSTTGAVSTANSMYGFHAEDGVGFVRTAALANGNYAAISPYWDLGGTADAGAVTWGNGATGTTGAVTSGISLTGFRPNDHVGSFGAIALANGNYVVLSPEWDNTAPLTIDAGAVTWRNGNSTVGSLFGTVAASNSLIGGSAGDAVGNGYVARVGASNYVVTSPRWDSVTPSAVDAGAATWGQGSTLNINDTTGGVIGVVSATNSLVGTTANDTIGQVIYELANGNYVVTSSQWDRDPSTPDAGAATWGSGASGVHGAVSPSNSLVGTAAGDHVASYGVKHLTNGNYVVGSPDWHGTRGAATWASGATGLVGDLTEANSLYGTTTGDRIGSGLTIPLNDGNYTVNSPVWDNQSAGATDAGALTWGNGSGGTVGPVATSNSLVGEQSGQLVGGSPSPRPLPSAGYAVNTTTWDNGGIVDAGATTIAGAAGVSGPITALNSLLGVTTGDISTFGLSTHSGFEGLDIALTTDGSLVVGRPGRNMVSLITVDLIAPVLATPPAVDVVAAPGASGAAVTYPSPAATTALGAAVVACTPPSGSVFPIGATTVTCTAANVSGITSSTSFTVTVREGTDYISLPPARVADSRPAASTIDGQFAGDGKHAGGSTMVLAIAGRGGVPVDASAVTLNVTVTEADAAGFVTAFPCGADQPTASNVNFTTGATVPNAVISKLGTGGAVCIFTSQPLHLVVDVNGAFPPETSYRPLNPARLLETRPGQSTIDGCLLYTSPSPRDGLLSRMPSSA